MREIMNRYRLIRRGNRGGAFYCVDTTTGKRTSLQTANEDEAQQIIEAKNQAERQPLLNLQIAKAYLAGTKWLARASDTVTAHWREKNSRRTKLNGNAELPEIARVRKSCSAISADAAD